MQKVLLRKLRVCFQGTGRGGATGLRELASEDQRASNNLRDIPRARAHNERARIYAHGRHANASFVVRGPACCTG